jgi:hypothetical protein
VLRVARRCWAHELQEMSTAALLREAEQDDSVTPDLLAKLRVLTDAPDLGEASLEAKAST